MKLPVTMGKHQENKRRDERNERRERERKRWTRSKRQDGNDGINGRPAAAHSMRMEKKKIRKWKWDDGKKRSREVPSRY